MTEENKYQILFDDLEIEFHKERLKLIFNESQVTTTCTPFSLNLRNKKSKL